MNYLSLAGLRASSISITIPRRGAWAADVELAGDVLAPTAPFAAVIVMGALTLVGTVHRQAAFGGAVQARIVGGAGGWRTQLPPNGYSHDNGVLKSSIIIDAATAVGETVVVVDDEVVGTSWVRVAGKAERVIRILAGDDWFVGLDGVTRVQPRPVGVIRSDYTATQRAGGKGVFEIATESFQDWLPGLTFASPIVPDVQTISTVILKADGDGGAARVVVLTGPSDQDRLIGDMRSIIQGELALLPYAMSWSYTIVDGMPGAADAIPSSPLMPQLTNVPIAPGVDGSVVTPAPGSPCVIQFLDCDPAKPTITSITGSPLLVEQTAAFTKIGDGARPAAAFGDLAGPFPIVATAIRTLI